jgi:ribosomal protein S18 acetylase RimI-like enzyme
MKLTYAEVLYDPPRLAVIDLIAYADGLLVTRINTPREHRRKGVATKLLRELCTDADRERTRLYLQVVPTADMNERALTAWYKRYGWREIPNHFIYVRDPGRYTLPPERANANAV